jgi:citrate:succinate antiporter/L-tartrate/succinate antiporter
MKQNWRFWLPFVVGFSLYFCPTPAGLENNQWHYFAIFAAVIVGLVVESMPVAAVGLIGLTLAAISGFIEKDPNKALRWALSGYSESTVWLIVGAFIFSIGYRKSGLGRRIALHLVKAMGKKNDWSRLCCDIS